MSNNIPVNGWPQLKDLEAVQPILNRLDKIEAWKRTVKEEIFTGDDITIENALALPARSLVTTIEAIQDLHGYDKPWVGGAGKNKLPMTVEGLKALNTTGTWSGNAYTLNGVTFTLQTDSDGNLTNIKVIGTPTSRVLFYIFASGATGGYAQNIFKGMILNGSNQNFSGNNGLYIAYSNDGTSWVDEQFQKLSEVTIKNNDYIRIEIMCYSGTFNNDFKPMLRLSTETDPTFAPWENKCPISGRTEARVDTENEDSTESAYATIQLGTTVYGAEINWDTGVMTVKTTKQTLNSDLTWARGGGASIPTGRAVYYFTEGLTGAAPCGSDDNSNNITMKSNVYNIANKSYNAMRLETGFALGIGGDNNISTIGCNVSSTDIPDATAFETWLDSNPIEIEYPLATPTTLQLTPAQLEMLKGYNRITLTDGYGTIELKALTGANWS